MKVLVLGGTAFLSAAVTREYLDRGHDVTCLSRSSSGRVPRGAREVIADRSRGREAYDNVSGEWDAVFDVATVPQFVRDALAALSLGAQHWTYVSSCSVYADQNTPGGDESCETVDALHEGDASSHENYAAAKVACEAACRRVRGVDVLVVRSGLIVGPGDLSDRGGYWPARFARDATPVLVPRAEGLFAQMMHVGDLAQWLVHCAQRRVTGTMNAVGAPRILDEVLDTMRRVADNSASVVPVEDQWLLEQGVSPWAGVDSLPLWIPRGQGFDGFTSRSHAAALGHGLRERDIEDTILDIIGDERTRGLFRDRQAGLSAAREASLIDRWRSR